MSSVLFPICLGWMVPLKPPLIRPVFIFFSWKREVFDFCLGGTVPFRRARFWIAHFFSGDKAGPLVGSKCRTRWEARLWVEVICCGWLSIRCWLLTTRNLCVPSQGGAKGSDPVRSMRLYLGSYMVHSTLNHSRPIYRGHCNRLRKFWRYV